MKTKLSIILLIVGLLAAPVQVLAQAGLMWGPVYVGNLKLYLTNPHFGYAGPKVGNTLHVNFHVDRKITLQSVPSQPIEPCEIEPDERGFQALANFHISKYISNSKVCAYVWESRRNYTVVDYCNDNWLNAAQTSVNIMNAYIEALTGYRSIIIGTARNLIYQFLKVVVTGEPL